MIPIYYHAKSLFYDSIINDVIFLMEEIIYVKLKSYTFSALHFPALHHRGNDFGIENSKSRNLGKNN